MSVRVAQVADAEGIATVHVASWQAAYRGLLPEQFLQNLSVERRTQGWKASLVQGFESVYVYEEGRNIVGFVSCGPTRDDDVDREHVGEVYAIYLAPSVWNKRYGAALLNVALDTLRNQGFVSVSLWVLHTNQRAIQFYERAEFQADGATKVDTRPGGVVLKEIRYRRSLTQ
ncbi:MAG: GNAT family N-acetyltransferase [Chloroflexota bacterium]|nr:GNAT family N-acetyltransferase [Chloroflexota bacterium]